MLRYSYSIIPLLVLLSSCNQIITEELVQEYKEEKNSEHLRELQEKLTEKENLSWQELHNLGYISYLLWQLGDGDIEGLVESLEYFRESYILGQDKRTKRNIEILEALLDELFPALEQEDMQEDGKDTQGSDETLEEEGVDSDDSGSGESSSEDDESGENPGENMEDISRETGGASEGNNTGESSDIQPQSEQIFQELGFQSQEELLSELEKYTDEMLQRQERNLQELRRQGENPQDIFEEFFGGGNPFMQDLPQQGEKDW